MKKRILILTLGLLAACSGNQEATEGTQTDEDARGETTAANIEPDDSVEPAERMTDPGSAALRNEAAEASRGMKWHFKPGWALFGPPESEGVLTFRCSAEGEGVMVARSPDRDVEIGANETLRFQSSKGSATAELSARDAELGPAIWEGAPASVSTLAELFDGGDAPIVATLGNERPLSLPADPAVAETLKECRAQL